MPDISKRDGERHVCYVTCSKVLAATPNLTNLLQAKVSYQRFKQAVSKDSFSAVLAWGRKPSALKAEQLAAHYQLPLLRIEDGFLRSVDLGLHSPPFSVVLDDLGIYYDASQPSRLEVLAKMPRAQDEITRAEQLCKLWQQCRVSKYNHSRELDIPDAPFVLVVDQTFGDAAIAFGQANAASFSEMLKAALNFATKHNLKVVVKTHPDVFTGKKQGYFSVAELTDPRIEVLASDIHAPALLELAQAVFCVTSQMGFEALLWGKPVYTFGMPFYAGWGLTTDALPAPARRLPISLPQLVYAALIAYPRYINPETGLPAEVEELLNWLGLQRLQRQRLPARLIAIAPSRWKRPIFRRFTQGSKLELTKRHSDLKSGDWLLKWGATSDWPDTVRVEDGFIRSVGLGADLIKPFSWVFDCVGMYYDATRPSALELMLQNAEFSAAEQQRAEKLRQLLLQHQVTKYNLGRADWRRPDAARVLLVPGQVESDASIRLGSPVLKTNLQLLQAVRKAAPDAYIVYKPHPDVLAGLRTAGEADSKPSSYYDELVVDQDMAHLFEQVDEIHTLTSLAGFEALLRGKIVYCYGQPFYSGWGLTVDRYPQPRRTRQRNLAELVAATLIRYPTYISWQTGYYTTPERVIDELQQLRAQQSSKLPWWRKVLRKLLAWYGRF